VLDIWAEKLPEFGALSAAWKLKAMSGQTPTDAELADIAELNCAIERFLSADKYLFAVPMWNFSMPYRLKQYFDVIIQPGKTFAFDPSKGFYGLVPSERPMQLLVATGGSYAEGPPMAALDYLRPLIGKLLNFIGLSKVETLTVDSTAYGPQVSDPILARAVTEAMTAASAF